MVFLISIIKNLATRLNSTDPEMNPLQRNDNMKRNDGLTIHQQIKILLLSAPNVKVHGNMINMIDDIDRQMF